MAVTDVRRMSRKGRPMFLFEEEREDAGCSGDGVARWAGRCVLKALLCALEEVEGDEDGEDAVAVVDGVGVDAVDAEEDERVYEKVGDEVWVLEFVWRGGGGGCAE